MPQMTGDTLAKQLMAIRPDIPVILCTGFSHRIDEEKARAMGPAYFMDLPWQFREGIISREEAFLRDSGKLLIPLPEIEVIKS